MGNLIILYVIFLLLKELSQLHYLCDFEKFSFLNLYMYAGLFVDFCLLQILFLFF